MCEMICKPSFRVYVLENARVITQLTMAIRVYNRSLLSFTPRKAWGRISKAILDQPLCNAAERLC